MIKLYFEKLLTTICLIFVFLTIYLIGFSVSSVLTNLIFVCRSVFLCIAAVCSLSIAYNLKIKNAKAKTEYITAQDISFPKNIIYAFKSKDYIAEMLAFETLVIPIFIYSAISERTTLVPFIVGTMTLIIISIIAFSLVDISLWLIVYKRWEK